MSDIVERLREFRPFRLGGGAWFGPKVCEEAADTITALRAEVARLRGVLQKIADRTTDEGGCYYKNKFSVLEARTALTQTKDTTDGA